MPYCPKDWRPKEIFSMIASRPTGASVVVVETDAGDGYLKGLGNEAGPHALACELIGSLAAEWLGLVTQDFSLIYVTDLDELDLAKGGKVRPGPAFISRAQDGHPWGGGAESLRSISNPEDITRLIILDTWIRNCDRYSITEGRPRINRDNVFLRTSEGGTSTLMAMDHTHAFTCGRDLTPRIAEIDVVQDRRRFGVFPEFAAQWDLAAAGNCLSQLETFTRRNAVEFVGEVPEQWEVPARVRSAIVDFLVDRAQWLASQSAGEWLSEEG